MENKKSHPILLLLQDIPDPRDEKRVDYPLINILFISLCAVICGAKGWEVIAEFGEERKEWFSRYLDLSKGIPSHDTFCRVFSLLKPKTMEVCFQDFIRLLTKKFQDEVLAIDGKTKKSPFDRTGGSVFLHMAHVWATKQQLLVGCKAIEGAPHEPKAFEELLGLLDLEGAIVTGDANNCTQGNTQIIRANKGHYVLALKANHHDVYEDIERTFEQLDLTKLDHHREEEKSHGREETREVWMASPSQKLQAKKNGKI
jgi:predicted transposase YbfD/YdcC